VEFFVRVPVLVGSVSALVSLAGCQYGPPCPPGTTAEGYACVDAGGDSGYYWDSGTYRPPHTGGGGETGMAILDFVGGFDVPGGSFSSGTFGYGYYGLRDDTFVCQAVGELVEEGPAPSGCPDCVWSFDLSAVRDSTVSGSHCSDFGISDGSLDGAFDYAWGFSEVYDYPYAYGTIALEDVVWVYSGGWFFFSFNYGGREWTVGDAESLEFGRPAYSGGAYTYYYYYL
jgi:hypothetical protein